MRLFAAVRPPAAEVAALQQHLPPLDERLRRVPPEQWHVTVAFYGEVPDDRVAELSVRLARVAARHPPAAVRLSGAGTFPRRATAARVLWLGVAGDVPTLSRLAASCVAAGRRVGVVAEERQYRPHLTLARARQPMDLSEQVAALAAYDGPEWEALPLLLVKSTLGPVARHEVIAGWPTASPGC